MPGGTSFNRSRSKLKPIGLLARLRNCLLSNQTAIELKELASESAIKNGFDVTAFKMITHSNALSILINIRHTDPHKKVSIDDCSTLNDHLDEAIQNSSIINQPFNLEISSEGIGEILTEDKDFQTFKGFPIEVTYQDFKKIQHQTNGLLLKMTDNDLQINQKGKTQRIPVEDVIQVRLTTPSG